MPTKAYAGASVPSLFEDLPDLRSQAITDAIFTGRSISNSVLMSSIQGPVNSLRKVYNYASSGNFHYGTPEVFASIDEPLSTEEAWIQYLQSQNTYSPPNNYSQYFLSTNIGNTENNGITRGNTALQTAFGLQKNPIVVPDVYEKTDIYTDRSEIFKIVTTSEQVLDENGDPVEDENGDPLYEDVETSTLHLTVNHPILISTEHTIEYEHWEQAPKPPTQGDDNYQPPTPPAELVGEFVHVYYEDEGIIPQLHIVQVIDPISEELYPIIPLRLNGDDYGNGLAGSADVKKILNYMDLDPEAIIEAIVSNPDEEDIDDVILGFGISINSDEEWAIAALAETFSRIHATKPFSKFEFDASGTRQNINFNSVEAGGVNNITAYNYTTSILKNGAPGYTKTYVEGSPITAEFATGLVDDNGDQRYRTIVIGSTNSYTFTRPTETVGIYEEIVVSGFTSVHRVEIPGFDYKEISFLDNEDEIKIPLFKEVVSRVPNRLREDLIFGSMVLYIYSYQIIKLKWYQTGIFKVFMIFVVVVLAIFTYGASIAAGFAAGVVAGLLVIGKLLLAGLLIDYAVQWLVEELGGALALLLVVIAAAYTGNFSNLALELNLTWYSAFSSAVKVYGEYTTQQLDEITDQNAAFESDYEDRMLELEAAQELLDYGTQINLLDVIEYRSLPNTSINEEPSSFYNRTSTTVDLPAISSSMVDDYYEIQAQLPVVDSYLPTHQFNIGV